MAPSLTRCLSHSLPLPLSLTSLLVVYLTCCLSPLLVFSLTRTLSLSSSLVVFLTHSFVLRLTRWLPFSPFLSHTCCLSHTHSLCLSLTLSFSPSRDGSLSSHSAVLLSLVLSLSRSPPHAPNGSLTPPLSHSLSLSSFTRDLSYTPCSSLLPFTRLAAVDLLRTAPPLSARLSEKLRVLDAQHRPHPARFQRCMRRLKVAVAGRGGCGHRATWPPERVPYPAAQVLERPRLAAVVAHWSPSVRDIVGARKHQIHYLEIKHLTPPPPPPTPCARPSALPPPTHLGCTPHARRETHTVYGVYTKADHYGRLV